MRDNIGEGDAVCKEFPFSMYPLTSSPTAAVLILLTGVTANTNSYTLCGTVGRVTFTNAPANGATILASYKYTALTSGEISDILSGANNESYLAAANACLVLAADTSRLFSYTMGDKTIDKRKISDNLRNLSAMYEERYYNMKDRNEFTGTVMTFKDDTGTPYAGFDSSVAFLNTTS